MPRASNRVGVEVDAAPQQLPAELLKAKKAERRARARQRAEEKRAKAAASQELQEPQQVTLEPSDSTASAVVDRVEQAVDTASDGRAHTEVQERPTSAKKLPSPEADESVDAASDTHEYSSALSTEFASLEQASAEYGTEEVLAVDAYVSQLLQQQQVAVAPVAPVSETPSSSPKDDTSSFQSKTSKPKTKDSKKKRKHQPLAGDTPSPDAAAATIQKALKRKFLKKCASFLRHSSKVFAVNEVAPAPLPTVSDAVTTSVVASKSTEHETEERHQQQEQQDKHMRPASPCETSARPVTYEADMDQGHRRERSSDRSTTRSSSRAKPRKRNRRRRAVSSSASSSSRSSSQERSGRNTSESSHSEHEHSTGSSSQSSRSSSSSSSLSPAPEPLEPVALGLTLNDIPVPTTLTTESHTAEAAYASELHAAAVIKIQSWLRGVDGRHRAYLRRIEFEREIENEALCEVHDEASVRIQAIARGYLIRRQLSIHGKSPRGMRGDRARAKAEKTKNRKKLGARNPRGSIAAFFRGTDIDGDESGAAAPTVVDEDIDDEEEDDHDHDTNNESVEPTSKSNGASPRSRRGSAEQVVAEWPTEFNLEGLDEWDELGSRASARGDLVTHAHFLAKGKLRVFCGTWNMHAKKPQDDLRRWIPLNKYHIVAVGSEECVHSIAKSVVFTSKKQWEDLLKDTLGEEYVLVSSHSLTAIHNIVFVHESVIPLLSNIQSDAVATGLGNQLGNKGGVGIAFSVGRTSFAFVNCHFDAHQHNTEKRNANFHRINQELRLFAAQAASVTSSSSAAAAAVPTSAAVTGPASLDGLGRKTASRFSLTSSSAAAAAVLQATSGGGNVLKMKRSATTISETFDRVFWFGDLNYRINGTRRMVDALLLENRHDVLRFNDQLQIEMARGNVFAHFQEGPLHFRPTYKFDTRSNVYDSSTKQRIPSWTDRILYLSNDKRSDIEILSYRSQMDFRTSDHRPVGAAFHVTFQRTTPTSSASGGASGDNSTSGAGTGLDQEFSRVLARGYKRSDAKSQVCAVQ